MLFDIISAMRQGDAEALKIAIASALLSLPIILLALSFHEMAHGFMANKLGDPTAKNFGRLTLNPLKHLDPIGFICMLTFGFGFAKPVPVETRYFKKPKRDMALTAAAGPVANLLLGFIFAVLLKIFYVVVSANGGFVLNESTFYIWFFTKELLQNAIWLNVALAVFNLIPCPPLDGSKILYLFLPPKACFAMMRYEQYIYIALLVLLVLGVITPIISFIANLIVNLFCLILFI